MYRIGFGSDIHRLEKGNSLILGGLEIPSDLRAVGHSDADVLLHAITDAILGALALGDIGSHFSDTDDRWEGANSGVFLKHAVRMMEERGFQIENIDSVISLERPKIGRFVDAIQTKVAEALSIDTGAVSIKAKTGEGLGEIGERRIIKAEACLLLRKT